MNTKIAHNNQKRVVMILQARMGSTRLPGKSLMPLAGEPLVGRVLERVKRCQRVDQVVLATTQREQDDSLVVLGRKYSVEVFRGSENDLVDRYYQAAKENQADVVVRVPADNPCPEPVEIDRIIEYHLESGNDFSSNYPDVFDNEYPDGIGAEVFNFDVLEKVWQTSTNPRNREHPHTNFYENPDIYKIGTFKCPEEFRRPDIVLDVNTQEEYEFLADLYDYIYPQNPEFSILDIIEWYDKVYIGGKVSLIYCFDIDGTLCTNTEGEYEKAQPLYEVIEQVNKLYDKGYRILLYTARGTTTGIDWREVTKSQMQKWGVRYHELYLGKPTAHVYIDDKAVNVVDWKRNDYRLVN